MVKLRSRLIRSPFSGGGSGTPVAVADPTTQSPTSSSAEIDGNAIAIGSLASPNNSNSNSSNSSIRYQQGTGIALPSNHARQRHQRQRQVDRRRRNQQQHQHQHRDQRSASSRMNDHVDASETGRPTSSPSASASTSSSAAAALAAQQRRPFQSISIGSSLSLPSSSTATTTPGTKRKPESRGITASIRRAKTAMFRMANGTSSPSPPLKSGGGGRGGGSAASRDDDAVVVVACGAEEDDADRDERMDAMSGDDVDFVDADVGFEPSASSSLLDGGNGEDVHNDDGWYIGLAEEAAADTMDLDREATTTTTTTTTTKIAPSPPEEAAAPRIEKNVLEWMREDAPPELLPRLLSFVGSRRMQALGGTSRAWNEVVKDESVWRVLCEDTHKWSDGDEVPQSWSQHYKRNPCVPIDYDTVDAAFDAVSSGPLTETVENGVRHAFREQRETCRILLHPGPYFLRRPLVANVAGIAEVTIECIGREDGDGCRKTLKDPEHGSIWQRNYHKGSSTVSNEEEGGEQSVDERAGTLATPRTAREHFAFDQRPSTPTLRQIFGSCAGRSSSALAGPDQGLSGSEDAPGLSRRPDGGSGDAARSEAYRAAFRRRCFRGPRPTAVLCLETRRRDEPAVRVRRGTLTLRGLALLHYCEGTDIWNGNAAVQVQTAFGRNGRPVRVAPPSIAPTANVFDCDITSLSGRGLVNIDGGVSRVRDCNIHDSAATGVYVGGAGSVATLERTDVVENGVGNGRDPRRGVARGHSGVYVEQGLARVMDCNVSRNTLTGISAISTEHARLHVEDSDVRANRSDQMELPPAESGRGVNRNNRISSAGTRGGRPRSRHLMDSVAMLERQQSIGSRRTPPPSPQSPL